MIFSEILPNSQEGPESPCFVTGLPQTVLLGNTISNVADMNNEAPAKTSPPRKLPVALLTAPSA
jgi:hypothetical protein